MVKVVAKNYMKEGKLEDVAKLVKELVDETRKEKGCIKYELFQDRKSSLILTFIEEWEEIVVFQRFFNA